MSNLEQPLQKQLDNVKGDINRLNELFGIDEFNTNELTHGRRSYIGHDTGINREKAIKHLAKIGEVKIIADDGNNIRFKVTEKFGKLQTANIGVPLSDHILRKQYFDENLEMMMSAYAILANFENRLRFLISSILDKNNGNDWWEKSVPLNVKNKVNTKKEDERRDWHIEEHRENIQYTEFTQLIKIMTTPTNWDFFEEVFGNQDVLKQSLRLLEHPRNIIAHSNVLSKEMYTDLISNTKKLNNLIDKYESKKKRFKLF